MVQKLKGWLFLHLGPFLFWYLCYVAIVSKLLPPFDNPILAAIQNDRYYCFLVPLTLPILVVAIYFHWLSMKIFKHA
uniref:Putative ovule protein n=1 Tax=Solanum chacoense TaxID=4108 RepID=A0A0V0HH37_SOLCH